MTINEQNKGRSRTDVPVLIVGAGPTGLAFALWLTKLGVKIRIIDKSTDLETTSRAVVIHARTLEFYRQVKISDAMVEGGLQVAGANLWTRGTKAMRMLLGRMGEGLSYFPYLLSFPQDLHEQLLHERLGSLGVLVERQTELVGFEQHHDNVQANLKLADGSEESISTAYLAGCDGAHSTVRHGLAIGFTGGTYSDPLSHEPPKHRLTAIKLSTVLQLLPSPQFWGEGLGMRGFLALRHKTPSSPTILPQAGEGSSCY